ncbi:hypothetical protein TNCV_2717111 [Trichonephila clavipes]|nr:hypothetical protein TNCV_2717111 [Trichonephila clavipes]
MKPTSSEWQLKKNEAAIRKSVIFGNQTQHQIWRSQYTRDVILERTERAIGSFREPSRNKFKEGFPSVEARYEVRKKISLDFESLLIADTVKSSRIKEHLKCSQLVFLPPGMLDKPYPVHWDQGIKIFILRQRNQIILNKLETSPEQ